MRTVVYSYDFEPITVIDLTPIALHYIQKNRQVTLPVFPVRPYTYVPGEPLHETIDIRQVCLRAERLIWRGREHNILFAYDEETALLLKSAFLAGQVRSLNDEKARAYAQGFLNAMARLGT